ncbi:MAG: polysaccharide biosynthesis C-terminal domain-containing protein [Ferruginibacter sp.]
MSLVSNFKALYKNPSVKSVGIYTFSNFFSKVVSFLLLFVFTNPLYITPSENGLLSLFSTSLIFLMPFLSLGIIHSTSTDFFKLEKKEFKDFFSTGFVMPVAVMICSTGILFLCRHFLQETYGFPTKFVWLIPAVTFLIFCNEQLLGLARDNNEPQVYLKANITKTILEFGLSFILVVYFAMRWEGRIQGIFISYLITGMYAFYYFNKKGYLFGRIQKKYLYSELLYAVPIMALQASIFAMNSSDKFFLSSFSADKNETVGIYSIACVFAAVVNILSMALLQYIFPKIYAMLSSGNVDYPAIRKFFFGYVGVMAVATLSLIVGTPFLYKYFINAKYAPALRYSYLLYLGNFLWTLCYFFYSFLLYHKKKKKILILSLCCIAVSLSCNYFFISKWLDYGAAVSTLVSYLIVFLITLFFTASYWKKFLLKPNSISLSSEQ